ncbi:uncharacterized protein LOC120616008 isoform X2 [Pteropus medius]|uniref:uncharacterized protein LOC120616008 isoform X2 n=1 Tax=Pteropus vampyrus TaxID=132908 RepID=UPI00196A4D3F|nr:uncharacterized protein LOC120616008 isoform X2 [Pteropus giganteus]
MDDLRVLWMRDRVYQAFGLTDPQLFEDLLNRDDGEAEDLILHFLNQTSDEEGASTLFFYRALVPEEVDVETDGEIPAPSEEEEEEEETESQKVESVDKASENRQAHRVQDESARGLHARSRGVSGPECGVFSQKYKRYISGARVCDCGCACTCLCVWVRFLIFTLS